MVMHLARSAEKTISCLRTLVEQSKQVDVRWPDLILLDIVMPGGSGFDVLKYLRATPEIRHPPVIIFTGHDKPNFREEACRLGANYFMVQPMAFEKTVETARQIYTWCSQGGPAGH